MPARKRKRIENPYRRMRPPDFVHFSLDGPCSVADVVKEIALGRKWTIDSLPPELEATVLPRGYVVLGSAREELMKVEANYNGWEFEIADNVLRTVRLGVSLSKFDKVAGHLMCEARRQANGRLMDGEYARIVAAIDKVGFQPIQEFEGKSRDALAAWNRAHSEKAIKTFAQALQHRTVITTVDVKRDDLNSHIIPCPIIPRREALRRLSRAKINYLAVHNEAKASQNETQPES